MLGRKIYHKNRYLNTKLHHNCSNSQYNHSLLASYNYTDFMNTRYISMVVY